jgi:hypothetical protein
LDGLVGDPGKPTELSVMKERWTRDEEARIREISSEDFGESLTAMVDWDSNYLTIVLDTDPEPSAPGCLQLIVYGRRFAKLLEETRLGLTGAQVAATVSRLQDDLRKWQEVVSNGQTLWDRVRYYKRVDRDSSELVVPLTMRINATILLIGERAVYAGLPAVVQSVDTLGNDTNWSAVGYACDKIMSSMPREGLSPDQLATLASYEDWKSKSDHPGFFQYKVVELPSFRSSRRPFERATSLGAEVDESQGTITVELPPIYDVWRSARERGTYGDPTGQNLIGKQVVEYARQFCAAVK